MAGLCIDLGSHLYNPPAFIFLVYFIDWRGIIIDPRLRMVWANLSAWKLGLWIDLVLILYSCGGFIHLPREVEKWLIINAQDKINAYFGSGTLGGVWKFNFAQDLISLTTIIKPRIDNGL